MRRRALAARLMLCGIAGFATASIGCVLPSARHLRCESDAEVARPLNLHRLGDRMHLRNDVERAEEIGVRFGDAYRKREGRTAEHGRQAACTASLLGDISARHSVSPTDVAAMRGRRPIMVDVAVFTTFTVFFAGGFRRLARGVAQRVGDSVPLENVVVTVLAVSISAAGTLALTLFGSAVEIVRLWDTHTSYRAGRLPWEQHHLAVGVALFSACLSLLWTERCRRTLMR